MLVLVLSLLEVTASSRNYKICLIKVVEYTFPRTQCKLIILQDKEVISKILVTPFN